MITVDSPSNAVAKACLDGPSGFAWWYLEVRDQASDICVVLIWGFGLPFEPGRQSAIRRGEARPARDAPSLVVSVYEKGKPTFYAFHELHPQDVSWGDGWWAFGDSTFRVTRGGRVRVSASLNLSVAGSGAQIVGEVVASGSPVRPTGSISVAPAPGRPATEPSPHRWTPLMGPGEASGEVTFESGRTLRFSGEVYCDRNSSPVDLESLGIRRWLWARCPGPSGERIVYGLWGDSGLLSFGVELDLDGNLRVVDLELAAVPWARAGWGVPQPERVEALAQGRPWLRVAPEARLDHGPFYLRHEVAELEPTVGVGTLEIIEPSAIDRSWSRPLVRMRVSSDRRENSMWLPLFQGAAEGRLLRLWSRLRGERLRRLPA